jgi:hypothetical protein
MANNQDLNPGGETHGTSYIYEYGTTPNTRAAVSQKVRVLTPAYGSTTLSQIGVLSEFQPTYGSRDVTDIGGIGFGDVIAELIPGRTQMGALSFTRAMMYLCNLWQACGYAAGVSGPVRSLAHHRWPFDVEEQKVFSTLADMDLNSPGGAKGSGWTSGVDKIQFPALTPDPAGNYSTQGHTAIITIFETCWFTSYSYSVSKDDATMMEQGEANYTSVHDLSTVYGEFMATGNDPFINQYGSMRYSQA